VTGSFATGLQVRSALHTWDGSSSSHIEISGNPVKFFQGHNLWGTDDLPGLARATIDAVVRILKLEPSQADRAAWRTGAVQLTRVDCTQTFHLDNTAQVLAWLRSAEQTAHLAFRGRGQLVRGSTLYFGKNSRRWSLKIYAKGQEIQAKGHGQESIMENPDAIEYANRSLRVELVMRSMELKRQQLDFVNAWESSNGVPLAVTAQLLRDRLGDMTMTTTSHLSPEVIESFRPSLRLAVASWESGQDLRSMMPRRTFYKFRAELLPHGIDIATLLPREVSNVVPLFKVLEAKPVGVPEWANRTALYFEPRRTA
jgi:II/X family phage/plasmid replication protein